MSEKTENDGGSENPIIWHYMEAWKFNALLDANLAIKDWGDLRKEKPSINVQMTPPSQGSLWFGLPDSFGDRREATFPALNDNDEDYCREMAEFLKLTPTEAEEKKQRFLSRNTDGFRRCVRATAKLCGATCWHKSDVETADMWFGFAPGPEDVAIKTNLNELMESLEFISGSIARKARVRPADVEYIDHNNFFTPYDGYRKILTFVRSDYDYERELRLTARSPQLVQFPLVLDEPSTDADFEHTAGLLESALTEWLASVSCNTAFPGIHLPIDLGRLIKEIRSNPGASPENLDRIQIAVEKKGLPASIVLQSGLATGA